MNILGIETSTRRAGLAIVRDGALLREAMLPDEANPSAQLVPALERLLKECGLVPAEIGGIAVGIGPGSFTGIRIGLATARGFCAARGTPLRGVGGFDNLIAGFAGLGIGSGASASPAAEGVSPPCGGTRPFPLPPCGGGRGRGELPVRICTVADAHSYGLYAAVYARGVNGYRREKEPFVCNTEELPGRVGGEVFFMGPHLGRFREVLVGLFGPRASLDAGDRFPSAATAALIYDGPVAVRDDPPGTVSPLYLLPGVRVRSVTRGR